MGPWFSSTLRRTHAACWCSVSNGGVGEWALATLAAFMGEGWVLSFSSKILSAKVETVGG